MDKKLSPKERMAIQRQAMPEQEAAARATNFEEVNLGFDEQLALLEAERCIQCKDPKCVQGCPVRVNIPRFIGHIAEGDLVAAAQSLLGDNALPSVTGRVCPQETQCEVECIRGVKSKPVAIGYLERYVADWALQHRNGTKPVVAPATGKKVAVVGAGPAGLTAAGELAKQGHAVTVLEALHQP
ncbi:MAG TPA: FAD-dependent monooxygenase, partial [Opitutaceae bacterium]|nr:FAD-dependent monooxygenase [Opitutaceae bacterium]